MKRARSAFHLFIARRLPEQNQIPLFSASGGLTAGREINMDMGRPILGGVLQFLMPLQSLVHISGLSYVERNPLPILGFFGIDVISWHRSEDSINGMNLVLILLAGLPRPTDEWGWRALWLWLTTE